MEFAVRAGDRRHRGASPGRRSTPPPQPFEPEAAARRDRVIREEVERRLIEEEVNRELTLARGRLHGGLGPATFVAGPDGPIALGSFAKPDGPFMPPMTLRLMPVLVGMHPNSPPPALFESREGLGPRRLAGFGQPMLLVPARASPPQPPPPTPMHVLQLREIAPSDSSKVLSSETKASGVKRKANASSVTIEPIKLQNAARDWCCALCQVSATSEAGLNQHLQGKKHKANLVQCGAIKAFNINKSGMQVLSSETKASSLKRNADVISATTEPAKLENAARDWCALCQVSATSEVGLRQHLQGKKHEAKLVQCGAIKAIDNGKSGMQLTTENKNSAGSSDAPKNIHILVDGELHQVVQKETMCGVSAAGSGAPTPLPWLIICGARSTIYRIKFGKK